MGSRITARIFQASLVKGSLKNYCPLASPDHCCGSCHRPVEGKGSERRSDSNPGGHPLPSQFCSSALSRLSYRDGQMLPGADSKPKNAPVTCHFDESRLDCYMPVTMLHATSTSQGLTRRSGM